MILLAEPVWCTFCQRWLRHTLGCTQDNCPCFVHTCFDAQPKLWFGLVGDGKRWHIGIPDEPHALCTLGTFKPLILANSEICASNPPLCKKCLRRWHLEPEYKDFL